MPIKVRMAALPGESFRFAIERVGDGAQFDFDKGIFVPGGPILFDIPLVEDKLFPGRYTLNAPHQQMAQFTGTPTCCFWLLQSKGGRYEIVYLESGIVNPPFTILNDFAMLAITEPTAQF